MTIDPKILTELKTSLTEEKKRIEDELSRIAKPSKSGEYETNFDDFGDDEDENASEVEAYTDNLALEDNLSHQLKEINEALLRMENGTYGFCENCRKEIDIERLKAYPSATTCVNCLEV